MDATTLLEGRRSIRKFKEEKVPYETLSEIIETARWAPSWANTQIARYNIVTNKDIIAHIAEECVKGFSYNTNTILKGDGVIVLSYVKGKSGSLDGKASEEEAKDDSSASHWESFDAGLACQQLCLAAYTKNIGTCIMGVIDNQAIAKTINLPENESVASIIVYGYMTDEPTKAPRRLAVDELMRVIE